MGVRGSLRLMEAAYCRERMGMSVPIFAGKGRVDFEDVERDAPQGRKVDGRLCIADAAMAPAPALSRVRLVTEQRCSKLIFPVLRFSNCPSITATPPRTFRRHRGAKAERSTRTQAWRSSRPPCSLPAL